MLEWICPKCNLAVPAGREVCPFCGGEPVETSAASPPGATTAKRPSAAPRHSAAPSGWADWERGFRFGLGFVAALAVAFFVLYLAAYFGGLDDLAERLARFIRFR